MKGILVFLGLLLLAAFAIGTILTGSYWGNPPKEQALAERIRIENKGIEEWQRIDLLAYQREKDDEAEHRRQRNARALLWTDRWNELGMGLAIVSVVGLLAIAAIWVAVPTIAGGYERYAQARAQLAEQRIKLEEKKAHRLREERRLEEVRLQWARIPGVQPVPSEIPGNGQRGPNGGLSKTRVIASSRDSEG